MSIVTWLDFSEAQQRKVLEALKGFEDKETVDDLGFGPIRDAISGTFFPGTSVLQTRARYFLFVPWIFQYAQSRWPADAVGKAFDMERKLITALKDSDDLDGVIGRTKGKDLKTLPSTIYWSGLQTFGIFKRRGTSIRQYGHAVGRPAKSFEYEGEIGNDLESFWVECPPVPDNFFKFDFAELALTQKEARWLAEKFLEAEGISGRPNLFRNLVNRISKSDEAFLETANVWDAGISEGIDHDLHELINHAKFFSSLTHGASLLYNVMLVEALEKKGKEVHFPQNYVELSTAWSVEAEKEGLVAWCGEIQNFWNCLTALGAQIPKPTMEFIDELAHEITKFGLAEFVSGAHTRDLVQAREIKHKGHQARLRNETRLFAFKGDAGLRPMNFRWNLICRIFEDIADGYAKDKPDAAA